MLDIKWIRENHHAFLKGLEDRGFDDPKGTLTRILKLDEERRATIQKLQDAQARRNATSKEVGQAKASKDEAATKRLMDEVAQLKTTIQEGETGERRLDDELRNLLAAIPNMPAVDVPVGADAESNVELRKVGTPKQFRFPPKQHFELGEALGLMDFEAAAKLSGARFVVLKGALARLERALAQFMLDLHTSEHDYSEIAPPLLVLTDTMVGTAQLPKFADDQFEIYGAFRRLNLEFEKRRIANEERGATLETLNEINEMLGASMRAAKESGLDVAWVGPTFGRLSEIFAAQRADFGRLRHEFQSFRERFQEMVRQGGGQSWLIPTAEVPLTNLVREEIVDEAKLPIRVTAGTPCFRAEAGAAGKDTRGMIRQHQFDKVELVSITTPEQSAEEHERMTTCAETVLKRLDLPFRTVVLSTGDMGFAAQKTYDIEVWLPGQGAYREISSCSNCGDFQARRMNARYRPKDQKQTRYVHTLNGSGVAVGRALIAVMENYQEEDGSIRIPDALQPYMGGLTKIEAKPS